MERTTIAVDLAKSVFEVAVANERGQILERKRLGRASFRRLLATRPSSRVVMEACGTAHHWGRVAQQQGHRVTLLPPQYVRPFVRRNKTDRADAEAAPGSDPGGPAGRVLLHASSGSRNAKFVGVAPGFPLTPCTVRERTMRRRFRSFGGSRRCSCWGNLGRKPSRNRRAGLRLHSHVTL